MAEADDATVACADCGGSGMVTAFVDFADGRRSGLRSIACGRCGGGGTISLQQAEWMRVGVNHRVGRLDRLESLGECAARLGVSRREVSDMEQGRADPARLVADIRRAAGIPSDPAQ